MLFIKRKFRLFAKLRAVAFRSVFVVSAILLSPLAIPLFAHSDGVNGEQEEVTQPALIVITHISSGVNNLDRDELRRIYFGKKKYWDNGIHYLPADHKKDAHTRQIWLTEGLGITDKEYKRKWLRNSFSGKAIPPVSFSTTEALIDYVSKNAGAIGYIPFTTDSLPATVRIIKVDGLAGIYTDK